MTTLLEIGTRVVADDGRTARVGQIADHTTDRWGSWHIVAIDGQMETVGHIGDAGQLGIGWRVATADDIRRARREHDYDLANQVAEAIAAGDDLPEEFAILDTYHDIGEPAAAIRCEEIRRRVHDNLTARGITIGDNVPPTFTMLDRYQN
jgi:hypothetical protein